MLYKSPNRKESTVSYQVTVYYIIDHSKLLPLVGVRSPVSSVVEHQTFNLRAVGSTPTSGVQHSFFLLILPCSFFSLSLSSFLLD